MSPLTLRQRGALRYAAIQKLPVEPVRTAVVVPFPAPEVVQPEQVESSTPWLQRWFERAGWFLFLLVGLAVFALSACGEFRPRPDLKVSTLTQSSVACVHGHKTEQAGTMGPYGTPVVLVTAEPCEVRP
jgi:hypothetical protein